jgi:hypothetical protein
LGLERHDTQRGAHLGRRHRTWLLRQTPLVDLIRRLRTKDDTRREKKMHTQEKQLNPKRDPALQVRQIKYQDG